MSLLTPIQPQTPSRELKLKMVANNIKKLSIESFEKIIEIQKKGVEALWNHPEYTPQEIINALGDNAIKVFQYHGGLTEYINSVAIAEGIQPTIKLPTNSFTIDATTGKITVSDQPYTP